MKIGTGRIESLYATVISIIDIHFHVSPFFFVLRITFLLFVIRDGTRFAFFSFGNELFLLESQTKNVLKIQFDRNNFVQSTNWVNSSVFEWLCRSRVTPILTHPAEILRPQSNNVQGLIHLTWSNCNPTIHYYRWEKR